MGLQKCQIFYDNPVATYFGGQTVTGRVELNFDAPKKVRAITIVFKGEAETHWTETESYTNHEGKSDSRTISYDGNEEYFKIKYNLIGNTNSEPTEIPPGLHTYPFTCALPPTLPSSFEGQIGHVRYTVKVTLDRPWKFDQTIKAAFTVLSPLDLNLNPRVREPATLTMEKYFCCCWCRSGPLTGIVKVPCTGFVSGQTIPMTIEIDNASSNEVAGVKIKLCKTVTYYSQAPTKQNKFEINIAEYNVGSPVAAKENSNFNQTITIPPLPPSNLQNCGIIDIDYEIKITINVAGMHRDMHGNLPIVIGTVPLTNVAQLSPPVQPNTTMINMNGSQEQLIGWAPPPGGASMDPYSMPPPTYEESQFGAKSIMDSSDSEHTRYSGRMYSPMYPVYHFMPTAPTGPGAPSAPLPFKE